MITTISPRTAFDPDTHAATDDGPRTPSSPPAPPGGAAGPPPAGTAMRAGGGAAGGAVPPAARLVALLRGYYRDLLAWKALALTTLVMCYAGGAALFWVHAIYLGEPGPRIRPSLHYLLDATAGLFGLTPALFFILPFTVWAAAETRSDSARPVGIRPVRYALVGGSVFALFTVGGPFAHDSLVARGTWIARHVTQLVGTAGAPTGDGTDVPLPESMLAQVVAGLPVYILLMWVSLHVVRGLTRASHRRAAGTAGTAGSAGPGGPAGPAGSGEPAGPAGSGEPAEPATPAGSADVADAAAEVSPRRTVS